MARINELTSDVYHLISAGEVVVSPTTLLKELIENSIDANAKHISIYVVKGGINEIKVVDDGEGIEHSEVEKAFKPHATSKILTKEDINKISTLGFRGEALSSISLVSNTKMVTRYKDEEDATYIELEGGRVLKKEYTASEVGTTITVTKLFYNMPARYKFLETGVQLNKEISKLVSAFVLSHPDIEFTLYSDGQKKFYHKKGDLVSAIHAVYGEEFSSNLVLINEKFDDFVLEGAIALPYVQKRNRSWQMVFVNNRWVECDSIEAQVNGAYTDFVMKGFFPCFVLNLQLPYELVDVNISPQKTIVKLERSEEISTWIMRLIKEILIDCNSKDEYDEKQEVKTQENKNVLQSQEDADKNIKSYFDKDKSNFYKDIISSNNKVKVATISPNKEPIIEEFKSEFVEEKVASTKLNSPTEIMAKVIEANTKSLKQGSDSNKTISHAYEYTQQSFIKEKVKVVGVLFDTYIIVEQKENFYIIDQHAAHERFLFDKYLSEAEQNEVPSQTLLLPYELNVSIEEKAFLIENVDNFAKMGIYLHNSTITSVQVTQVPTFLVDEDLGAFFGEILSNLQSFSRDKVLFRHQIATHACKSAIKANDVLKDEEIEKIIDMVQKSKSPLLCPHGRPYVINIKKAEVEKWFKRAV